jgi:hypothetical protein
MRQFLNLKIHCFFVKSLSQKEIPTSTGSVAGGTTAHRLGVHGTRPSPKLENA